MGPNAAIGLKPPSSLRPPLALHPSLLRITANRTQYALSGAGKPAFVQLPRPYKGSMEIYKPTCAATDCISGQVDILFMLDTRRFPNKSMGRKPLVALDIAAGNLLREALHTNDGILAWDGWVYFSCLGIPDD